MEKIFPGFELLIRGHRLHRRIFREAQCCGHLGNGCVNRVHSFKLFERSNLDKFFYMRDNEGRQKAQKKIASGWRRFFLCVAGRFYFATVTVRLIDTLSPFNAFPSLSTRVKSTVNSPDGAFRISCGPQLSSVNSEPLMVAITLLPSFRSVFHT